MHLDSSNHVVVSPQETAKHLPRRTLNLSNIRTEELKLLSPRRSEIAPEGASRVSSLLSYSERLRNSYRANEGGLRYGMLLLGQTLSDGQTISVSCFCRAGEMCHADVVKMAIEKVSEQIKIREAAEWSQTVKTKQPPEIQRSNPRTLRAISEILSVSRSDMLLAKIDNTEGRSQSEHASYLNKYSQFARDLYERGAIARDGVLISPKETLSKMPSSLTVATNEYAVSKLERILHDQAKAKDLAPILVEHGKRIAGTTADRETQIKVFTWMYDSLEGKNNLMPSTDKTAGEENGHERFDRTLGEIARLAEEMNRLEPTDKFVALGEHEQQAIKEPTQTSGDELSSEEIYWYVGDHEHLPTFPDAEMSVANRQEFDRVDLGNTTLARLAANLPKKDLDRWIEVGLPALDREIENGKPVGEILKNFQEVVYQTAKNDPSNKQAARDDLQFASAYIDHQLKQPESRLRHFNPRYRNYAAMLEIASSKSEVLDAASSIRQENARVGFEWGKLSAADKAKTQRPLTSKEMQFLFTEVSPRHYTADMTVARLGYSHSGASRRMMTDALMKGEIKTGEETQRLVESLEARLVRRHLKDSISATKHFLESLKTPNEELRYKNSFDHKEIYSKLPPAEKDFVYQRAVQQKEQLEARSILQQKQPTQPGPAAIAQPEIDKLEKAASFRDGIKSELIDLIQKNPSINCSDLIDQTNLILTRRLTESDSLTITKDKNSTTSLSREISDKIESALRFNGREHGRAGFGPTRQDSSSNKNLQKGRISEPDQPHKERLPERSYVR